MRVGAIHSGPSGYIILGAWVFAEQIGVPLPATPALLAAGVLAAAGRLNAALAVAIAVAASVLADYLWFRAGASRSDAVNRFLQRHPNSKLLQMARGLAAQLGSRSLVVAKFVPGLSLLAPPLSGVSGTRTAQFLLFDSLGALLWAGSSIGIGYFIGRGGSSSPIPISPQSCACLCAAFALGAATFRLAGWLWIKLQKRSLTHVIDERISAIYKQTPEQLAWLSNLITGENQPDPDPIFEPLCSRDSANPFFRQWSNVWFRKLVLAKTLDRVAAELKDSARRTAGLNRPRNGSAALPLVGRYQLERALLTLDLFPRCVILLTMFEQLSVEDTAILLDANKDLIEKTRGTAMAELYASVAHKQGRLSEIPPASQPALAAIETTA